MLKMENLLKIGQPRSMGGRVETDMRASHLKASSMRSNYHLPSGSFFVIALIYLTSFRGQGNDHYKHHYIINIIIIAIFIVKILIFIL